MRNITETVKHLLIINAIFFVASLSLGDLAVKIFVALVMLIPFRLLLGTLKPV